MRQLQDHKVRKGCHKSLLIATAASPPETVMLILSHIGCWMLACLLIDFFQVAIISIMQNSLHLRHKSALQNNHVCVENSMRQNCPVCFEYLFDSVRPTAVLPCGHTIHSDCLREMEHNRSGIIPYPHAAPLGSLSLGLSWSRSVYQIQSFHGIGGCKDQHARCMLHLLCHW